MKVVINGREEIVDTGLTVEELLLKFRLNPDITIVEKNRNILPREVYASEDVKENDSFELIRYMGGG